MRNLDISKIYSKAQKYLLWLISDYRLDVIKLTLQYLLMKFIVSLILVLLLVGSTTSTIVLSIVGPLTKTAIKCLFTSGNYGYIIFRIYKVSGTPGIDLNGLQTLVNAHEIGSNLPLYMQICRGINATSQVNAIRDLVDINLYQHQIYVKVEPNNTPGCSWDGYSQVDNCNFLNETIYALGQFTFPSIFSTANIWKKFFGSNCDYIGGSGWPALWYAHYNSNGNLDQTESFEDFVSFGGWNITEFGPGAFLKQVAGNKKIMLCGNPLWHVLADELWSYY